MAPQPECLIEDKPRLQQVLRLHYFKQSREAASEAGKRPLPPERTDIVSSEADFLHPYGHLRRETYDSIKDSGVIVNQLRGGIGYSAKGDKAYRQTEYASGHFGEKPQGLHGEAKPAKWYTDPRGPQPKIQWVVGSGANTGGGQISGRPLWAAPLSGGGTKGGGGKVS